jgi:hypothetical protein
VCPALGGFQPTSLDGVRKLAPKYIAVGTLAKMGDVSIPTMLKLMAAGTLKSDKFNKTDTPLFLPDAPDVVA